MVTPEKAASVITGPGSVRHRYTIARLDKFGTDPMTVGGIKDSIAVATNSRSMIFVTIVSCVRWFVCVFDPIHYGASLRLSVYV